MPEITTSDGLVLFFDEWGDTDAPPLLLLHGFTSDHRMWAPHFDELSRSYRVIAPDMRGHGVSGAPEDLATYTMDRYAEDVRDLLDALGVDLAAVCGCSFGGMVAMHFAVTWPERIAALVLSDTSPAYEHPRYDDRFREREAGIAEMEDYVRARGTAALGKRQAASISDPFLATAMRERYAALSTSGFLGAASVRRERPDLSGRLRDRLTMPVMLCDGEDDPVYCALDVMADELPNARVLSFAGVAHGLPALAPQPFGRALLDFLADVEDGNPVAARRRVS